jgi:3-oxoacyl-[acyl-carrier protein] reductase
MVYLAQEKATEDQISLEEATAILADETVLKRYGEPRELAALVAFVASERASYITGAMFDVDGGQVKAL